jgi:hypothetical protein
MNNRHRLHSLVVSSVLSLLMLTSLASPILASSEDIELDVDEGEIGDKVDLYGEDFDYVRDYVTVCFSDKESEDGEDIDDEVEDYEVVDSGVATNDDGEWATSFDIPDEPTDGDDDQVGDSTGD